jgi:hypothetical protein
MNKKFYAIAALFLVIVSVFTSAAFSGNAAEQAPLAIDSSVDLSAITSSAYTARINGKGFAMNPTMLPAVKGDTIKLNYAMNPTMLPLAESVAPDVSHAMNPTMLPLDDAPDTSYAMNPTMYPLGD